MSGTFSDTLSNLNATYSLQSECPIPFAPPVAEALEINLKQTPL